jgi:hypothetical protein
LTRIQRTKGDIVRLSDWQRHFDNVQRKRTLRHAEAKISGAASDRELHDRNESAAETQLLPGRERRDEWKEERGALREGGLLGLIMYFPLRWGTGREMRVQCMEYGGVARLEKSIGAERKGRTARGHPKCDRLELRPNGSAKRDNPNRPRPGNRMTLASCADTNHFRCDCPTKRPARCLSPLHSFATLPQYGFAEHLDKWPVH